LLRGAVPAVLTNRPYASVQTAGDLAVEILLRILFHNMPPHVTLQGVAWNRQSEDLAARSSPDWVNLTLFRNYRAWHSFSVSRKSSRIPDPIWHVKIDRRHQFNMVSGNVRLMLLYQRPKSYAFIWYGLQDQGQEVFHQRLNSELQEVFNEVDLIEFSPQWPLFPEGGNYDDLFTAMIKQAFGANQDLDEVPGIIRRHTHDSGNRQTLVYVRHTPVTSKKHLSPEQLQQYLKWWDLFAVPQFHEGVYGLLGISFVVKNPAVFKEVMDKRKISQVKGYKNSQVEVLDKLDKLVEDDLIRFFDTHDVKIPEEAYEPIAKKIIRESNGVYNSTLELIEREIYKYWDDAKEEVIINEDKEEDEDY